MAEFGEEAVLRAYFKLFDTLFYGSTLHSHCIVKLTPPRRRVHADMTQFLLCWHCPPKAIFVTIKIRIFRKGEMVDDYTRLNFYLGRLLHEMSHAFLELFSCRYEPCHSSLEHLGITGHGFAWQEITFAVEKAANDHTFLDLSVDLHRQNSLGREPEASSQTVSSLQLSRWGFKDQTANSATK